MDAALAQEMIGVVRDRVAQPQVKD